MDKRNSRKIKMERMVKLKSKIKLMVLGKPKRKI